jgi:hypothetical protein
MKPEIIAVAVMIVFRTKTTEINIFYVENQRALNVPEYMGLVGMEF